ncbi:MAG: chemotaxis-specific protein-glutamate methyltransferase CheB [Proteobacteria bacterium]|nr:chemotaxis-specific protein-glutamate methyltransferase CheB [Pseudomonadota bacterium]
MGKNVSIMVVDDSITYRRILSKIVEEMRDTELVGTASSGKTALMKLPTLKPHLVFLDIMMPELDGIETLRKVKEYDPNIQVVMVSGIDSENARSTLKSLENGALDFVAKPNAVDMKTGLEHLKNSLEPLVEIVRGKVYPDTNLSPTANAESAEHDGAVSIQVSAKKTDFVLIGVSTGGPNALSRMFMSIRDRHQCPILIVQHMPPVFTESLAERLNAVTPLEVKEARDSDVPLNGHVYIAPGGKHMILRKTPEGGIEIGVVDSPPVNHCKPAVDVLFGSVAELDKVDSLCIVMTGMGRDGTEGVRKLKSKGTPCLIQDKESSVVWGMPGSVYDSALFDEVLPLDRLGERIAELTS